VAIARTSFAYLWALGLLLVTIVIGVPRESPLAADTPATCSEQDPREVFKVVKKTPSAARLVSPSKMLAADGQNSLIFDSPTVTGEKYRVLIEGKPPESDKRLHLIDTVLAQPLDTPLATTLRANPKATMVTFNFPRESAGYWALNWMAVGTRVTPRPPHRTGRAAFIIRLPPRMSDGEALRLSPYAHRRL
jgi:hypothetical protein